MTAPLEQCPYFHQSHPLEVVLVAVLVETVVAVVLVAGESLEGPAPQIKAMQEVVLVLLLALVVVVPHLPALPVLVEPLAQVWHRVSQGHQ